MLAYSSTKIDLACDLDAHDELARFRDEFVFTDPNLIYLDGNSPGRLPRRNVDFMRGVVEHEWGERLVRGWGEGWMDAVAAARLLADPAPVVGQAGDSAEVSCRYDPATLLRDGGATLLAARIMACYGRQATRIPYQGKILDRLTIFGLLGTTADRAERERLFRRRWVRCGSR